MSIIITGGSGLVGKYLRKYLPDGIYLSSKDYDLTNELDVIKLFDDYKPNTIIHLAAKVGGILDNINNPYEYFTDNVLMNTLLLKWAHKTGVERFIGILSTCIYPDQVFEYPMKEEDLHLGPPTTTNFSYGYAKRSLAVQIDALNKQYGTKYQYLIPCNLYGVGDKDDEKHSHFLTALIKKIFEANQNQKNEITLFGDGTPLRQFMFADDLAKIIFEVIDRKIYKSFNVATESNLTIKNIAEISLAACESKNLKINWDITKPNGQYRKDVSTKKLKTLLPDFKFVSLEEGIKLVYSNYYDKFGK